MFRGLAEAGLPLQRMMETANRIFCQSTPAAHFATLVAGRADSDGSVEFVSAGHVPILYIRRDAVRTEEAPAFRWASSLTRTYPASAFFFEKGSLC